ncbi:MAG: hypothetical protein WBA41_06605 [Rivularia sp. (in: cyanobacteria)]
MRTENHCKYLLYFDKKAILPVRVETDNPIEIHDILHGIFGDTSKASVTDYRDLMLVEPLNERRSQKEKLHLVIKPEEIYIRTGHLLCGYDFRMLENSNSVISFNPKGIKPLSVPNIESILNDSLISYKHIATVKTLAKVLGINILQESK